MEDVLKVLKSNDIKYAIGIINNGTFFELKTPFKDKQVIKIKWVQESIDKLINKLLLANITISCIVSNNFYARYKIENTENELLVEYIVNSHVQLPHLMLKNFVTGKNLYYIDTSNNCINKSSAKKYNTERGYYSKWFEQYLSDNYENPLSNLILKILPFSKKEIHELEIPDLNDQINKIYFMSIFRDPNEVKKINSKSVFAQIMKNGICPEDIALTCKKMENNILKGLKPLVVINTSSENFVMLKSLFSNLALKKENCMFLTLHPKFGIAMVSNKYYYELIEEFGDETFIMANDIETIRKINMNIYDTAKNNNTHVIGIKSDLENIISEKKTIK